MMRLTVSYKSRCPHSSIKQKNNLPQDRVRQISNNYEHLTYSSHFTRLWKGNETMN